MPIRISKKSAAELLFSRLRKAQQVVDEHADDDMRAKAQHAVDEITAELRKLGVDPDPQPQPQRTALAVASLPAPPDDEHYTGLVQQGQAAMAQGANAMWQLGKLASEVETHYGQNLLQRYADDIDCNYQTLKRCRTTFKAWDRQKGPHGPIVGSGPFAVCRALVPLPNRAQLLAADPGMTERAALEHARAFRDVVRPPPCPLHKLYALLRQPKLLELVDETIANRDEEYGPLRLQAAEHIALVIGRLQGLETALRTEPEPVQPQPVLTLTLPKPRPKSTDTRRRRGHK
jgi:hypothetical protein